METKEYWNVKMAHPDGTTYLFGHSQTVIPGGPIISVPIHKKLCGPAPKPSFFKRLVNRIW